MNHTRLLVENILRHPTQFAWSVQGLGMMRTYLSDEVRLHIWDSSLKVPGVSALHTHPWDLDSYVVAGRYKQHRYVEKDLHDLRTDTEEFNFTEIKCGEGACTLAEPKKTWLAEQKLEVYPEGLTYHQNKEEIHLSLPEDGTVTIVSRTFHEDRDTARVYWRGHGLWVDAKPRAATEEEVGEVTHRALLTWF